MGTIEYLAAFAARYCSIIIVYRMLLFTAMNNRSIEASKIIFWEVVLFFAFSTVTVSLMFDVFKNHYAGFVTALLATECYSTIAYRPFLGNSVYIVTVIGICSAAAYVLWLFSRPLNDLPSRSAQLENRTLKAIGSSAVIFSLVLGCLFGPVALKRRFNLNIFEPVTYSGTTYYYHPYTMNEIIPEIVPLSDDTLWLASDVNERRKLLVPIMQNAAFTLGIPYDFSLSVVTLATDCIYDKDTRTILIDIYYLQFCNSHDAVDTILRKVYYIYAMRLSDSISTIDSQYCGLQLYRDAMMYNEAFKFTSYENWAYKRLMDNCKNYSEEKTIMYFDAISQYKKDNSITSVEDNIYSS